MYKEYFYHIPFTDEKVSFILWNAITSKTRVMVDQGPLSEIWWCLSRVDKTKKFRVYSKFASNGRKSFILKPVLQKGTPSSCVLFIHKPSKHDHVIYGTTQVQTSRKTN